MKMLQIVFSVYLLLLSFWPCADEKQGVGEDAAVAIMSTSQHHHTDEACTPFCSCACCTVSVCLPAITTILSFYPIDFTKQYAAYLNPFQPRFSCSIWQPPQLVS